MKVRDKVVCIKTFSFSRDIIKGTIYECYEIYTWGLYIKILVKDTYLTLHQSKFEFINKLETYESTR